MSESSTGGNQTGAAEVRGETFGILCCLGPLGMITSRLRLRLRLLRLTNRTNYHQRMQL